ncbi:MAG: RnfABCDGE type electron transport complex subunit D [Vallitaleaceae bacterium]|nr:RnfABCDGE type electron transport complex subunit D [Vallitaleaceae bacterium]
MQINLLAGSSPHIKNNESTRGIMLDVIIALTPAMIAAIYFFKLQAALLILVTVTSCVLSEYIWNRVSKKKNTLKDLSAVVTGLLLAFNLSPYVPLWVAAIGGAFAIIIVKQMFGGLGHNFINPALAARAFLMASWPVQMTTWKTPGIDAVGAATPLALIKEGGEALGQLPALFDLFVGNVGGCIGETSVLALLLGAAYLLIKKVITPEIPIAFIGTVGVMTWVLGGDTLFTGDFLYQILAGGLMLGAFFMATDYTTSPMTLKGRIVMGIGCGLLTTVIRLYGGYPEGVSYSILLMNLTVPLIDKFFIPKSFGGDLKNA